MTMFRTPLSVMGMADSSRNMEVGNRMEFNDNPSGRNTVPNAFHILDSNRALSSVTDAFGARRGSRSNCIKHRTSLSVIAC